MLETPVIPPDIRLMAAPEWPSATFHCGFCLFAIEAVSVLEGDLRRRLPRTPSTGTMSSADDLDDREPLSPLDNGEVCPLFLTLLASQRISRGPEDVR